MITSTSLLSAFRSQKRPNDDPRLSPSGRTWEVIANRSFLSNHPSSFLYSFQQRIDATRFLFHRVAHEVKRGSMPQIERKAKLLAHVRRRVTKRYQSLFVFLLVAFDGHVNAGIAQVVRDANFSNRHQRQARVFEFVTNNLRNFFTQSLRNALWPMHDCKDEGGSMKDESLCASSCSDLHQSLSSFRLHPSSFLKLRRRDLLDHVAFDLIADFNVVKVFKADTALESFTHFRSVVLEPS